MPLFSSDKENVFENFNFWIPFSLCNQSQNKIPAAVSERDVRKTKDSVPVLKMSLSIFSLTFFSEYREKKKFFLLFPSLYNYSRFFCLSTSIFANRAVQFDIKENFLELLNHSWTSQNLTKSFWGKSFLFFYQLVKG